MRPSTSVLLVDPEGELTTIARDVVYSVKGCRLECVPNAEVAIRQIRSEGAGVLLVYLGSPADAAEASGLLIRLAAEPVTVPVIFLSEDDDPDLRLRLIKEGAVECLGRPLDLSRLAFLVDLLTVRPRCKARWDRASQQGGDLRVADYLFDSPRMQEILAQLREIAPLGTTILLTGETGTGKTHLARAIHDLSPRRNRPFVVVHCGSLAASLLESELFGHVRGAFTHAVRDRTGRLAEAQDGTLFLDEIDAVPLESQAKLLQAMEERVFGPLGAAKRLPLRARVVVATNRPLAEDVAAGRFRADLYYRLDVISFHLPPLRERKDLIEPLVEKFLAEFGHRNGRPARGMSMAALSALVAYDWPGNIRELRNVLERASAFCAGRLIDVDDLPEAIRQAAHSLTLVSDVDPQREPGDGNRLAEIRRSAERRHLVDTLARNDNNRTTTATELGVSRMTLYKKLHKFGLV